MDVAIVNQRIIALNIKPGNKIPKIYTNVSKIKTNIINKIDRKGKLYSTPMTNYALKNLLLTLIYAMCTEPYTRLFKLLLSPTFTPPLDSI